eukprot:COSAG01_NODE_2050_length_8556_cov_63.294312_11_plen_577_part_00
MPLTCEQPACARAVQRVAGDCSEILRQGWFETWSNKLAAAVAQCALVPPPPSVYPIGPATPTMWQCDGAQLTDGDGQYGPDWNKHTIIDAGPGKVAQVTVQTLSLGSGDSLQIFDGPDCQPGPLRLTMLQGRVLPSQPAYTASGRFLCVQLLTDSHGLGAGFTMSVDCVCADSPTWVDATGRPCAHFARNATSSAFGSCEGSAEGAAAQGRVAQTGLALPAEQACPRACEACGVDPCHAWPCQHSGVCLQPEPQQCQTAGQFASLSTDVTAACCNEPGEDCEDGAPRTCNADCARILVPVHRLCSKGVLQTPGFEATKQTMDAAVAKCATGHGHRRRAQGLLTAPTCSCVSGWTGAHCETEDGACAGVSCGGHGSCHAGACECTAGWTGAHCETPPDPCRYPAPVSCGAHSSCQGGICSCVAGWSGARCETECGGHGRHEGSACECAAGWGGAWCDTAAAMSCPVGATAGGWDGDAKYCSDLAGYCVGAGGISDDVNAKVKLSAGLTRGDCQAACDATSACVGYAYDASYEHCYVYGPGLDRDLHSGWRAQSRQTTTIFGASDASGYVCAAVVGRN